MQWKINGLNIRSFHLFSLPLIKYKEQDSPKQTAQEPMMATYHQSAIPMDDFINSIPRDALAEALLFALEENKAGHCISNSQIESMINERMGWK